MLAIPGCSQLLQATLPATLCLEQYQQGYNVHMINPRVSGRNQILHNQAKSKSYACAFTSHTLLQASRGMY